MSGSNSPVVTTLTVDDAGLRKGLEDATRLINGYVRTNEQAARALTTHGQAAEAASGGTRNLGVIMGQAGFQVQDFATQVSMGQNALTAFSVQFAQFAGIFGTAGAIAGAVVTVGLLGSQFLGLGQSTDVAKQATEGWAASIKALNDLMETSAERAARLRSEQIQTGRVFALQQMQQSQFTVEQEGQRALRLERDIANLRGLNRRLLPDQRTANENEIATLEEALGRARAMAEAGTGGIAASRRLLDQFGEQAQRGGGTDKAKPTIDRARGGGSGVSPGDAEAWRTLSASLRDIDNASSTAAGNFQRLIEQLDPAEAAAKRYEERIGVLAEALNRGVISQDDFNRGLSLSVKELDNSMARAGRRADDLGNMGREIATVFTSAFDGMITGARSFEDALQRLGMGIARMLERALITKPLESALSKAFEGQSLGGLAGSAGKWIWDGLSGLFGGARAGGGPVASGMTYLVGENGPELFTPGASGQITPNHAMGGGIYIDARGADPGVEARIRHVVMSMLPTISAVTRGEMFAEVNRGGSAAVTMGRRR